MRKGIITILMMLAALVLLALFLDNMVFVVKDVEISGSTGMSNDEVIRAAGVDMGGRMRSVDEAQLARNIEKTGILKCDGITKKLPDTLVLEVSMREGRYVSDFGGSIALMDRDCVVISVSRELPEGDNLYVTGLSPRDAVPGRTIGADYDRVEALRAIINAVDACGVSGYISEINVEETDALYLYSRTGIRVALGDSSNMQNKLIWMKYALIDLEARGETSGRLDVTSGTQADYSAD